MELQALLCTDMRQFCSDTFPLQFSLFADVTDIPLLPPQTAFCPALCRRVGREQSHLLLRPTALPTAGGSPYLRYLLGSSWRGSPGHRQVT
jgi:hypothetical protein